MVEGDDAVAFANQHACGAAVIRTGFVSTLHSWRLPNLFHWGPRGRWVYGLCGGLCYAALDYWVEGRPLPLDRDTACLRPSMLAYLWRRQIATLAPRHLYRLARWLLMADITAEQMVFSKLVPELGAALNTGRPVPLMLVRTKGVRRPWDNHQVVAHGCRVDPATAMMHIQVYDPNHPGQTVEIVLDPAGRPGAPRLAQSTGERLRGLFLLAYRPARPPAA